MTRNDYYGAIIKYCVINDTKYFSSKWFYDKFPNADVNLLHNLCRDNLLKTEKKHSRTYYVSQFFTNVRYLGLCLCAYIRNNNNSVNPELTDCVRRTWLSPELTEFLILTYDVTSAKKATMLDMSLKEIQILEDYFYLRLASNVIKDELEFPIGHTEEIISSDI